MKHYRIIPCLLMADGRLVKTVGFENPNYVGDPLNVIRIFNDKYVDELVILDINSTKNNTEPNFSLLDKIAKEAFMPMAYGGGINSLEMIVKVFKLGFEKVIINQYALMNPNFITEASNYFGSQSILVAVDVIMDKHGEYKVFDHVKKKASKLCPVTYAEQIAKLGAGEIIVYSVDNDGKMNGYDLKLTKHISEAVNVPVVALGGAGKIEHLLEVIENAGASAAGAGSMFIYRMPHKAVLISYPSKVEIEKILNNEDKKI